MSIMIHLMDFQIEQKNHLKNMQKINESISIQPNNLKMQRHMTICGTQPKWRWLTKERCTDIYANVLG